MLLNRIFIFTLFVAFSAHFLSGCGDPMIKAEYPFQNDERAIHTGKTTKAEVHKVIGSPIYSGSGGQWELYSKLGDGIALIAIVPFPAPNGWVHYLLITYDNNDRVTATGTAAAWSSRSAWNDATVYAGNVGLFTGTRTAFPSVDSGGPADEAWEQYLRMVTFYAHTRKYYNVLPRYLCKAVKHNHPCAYVEVANYFWHGSDNLDQKNISECSSQETRAAWQLKTKDNIKACVWFSMADKKILPSWCLDELSPEQNLEVNRKLKELSVNWHPEQWKWYPNQCTSEF